MVSGLNPRIAFLDHWLVEITQRKLRRLQSLCMVRLIQSAICSAELCLGRFSLQSQAFNASQFNWPKVWSLVVPSELAQLQLLP